MFNNFKHILIGVLSAVIVIAVGASAYNAFASPAVPTANTNTAAQYGNGNGNGGNGNGGQTGGGGVQLTAIPASDLSAEEAAALLYMREEEKLARDVYNQMYALWGQPSFRISPPASRLIPMRSNCSWIATVLPTPRLVLVNLQMPTSRLYTTN